MNHFNFFEDASKGQSNVNLPFIVTLIILAALLVFGGLYAQAKLRLNFAEKDLAYLESVETNPKFQEQYRAEKELEANLNQAEADYIFLRSVEWLAEDGSTVSSNLVKTVLSYFSSGAKVLKINLSHGDLTVEGVAESLTTMVKIEKELKQCDMFDSVFINTAKQDSHKAENGGNSVTFTCQLTLSGKGGE